jgi:hypothetical protein
MSSSSLLSRRAVLAGAAAVPLVGMTAPVSAWPGAGTRRLEHPRAGAVVAPSGDLADVPIAVRTVTLPGVAFRPTSSTIPWETTSGVLRLSGAGTVEAPFTPAIGDNLVGVVTTADPAGSPGVATTLWRVGQTTTDPITVPAHVADPTAGGYLVSVDLPAGVGLRSVAVTYFSATSSVVFIEPRRVWDSRTVDGYLVTPGWNAGGKLRAGDTLSFNLDGVVPRYINGVIANVTLDDTEGAGYVVLWQGYGLIGPGEPESPVVPPTSTANWYAGGQTVANLAISKIGGGAGLAISSGGNGRTHLIVDVLGYLT